MAASSSSSSSEARKRRAQVGGILLAEAHVERAGAGQPHAVAAFAEIMGERRDEAEPAAGLRDPHIARRAAGLVGDVLEREALQRGAPAPATAADTGRCGRRRCRPAAWSRSASGPCRAPCAQRISVVDLVLVDALQRHGVDLDCSPAACAASMPSITLSRSPQRVIALNLSGRACRPRR